MVKKFLCAAALAFTVSMGAWGADYGLPSNIQDGNILHCFNWKISEVRANLANIAAAGYGSVQLSPLQRGDVGSGTAWHDLYRPYDIAFKGGLGSESELQQLCSEAANYGIKVIVDVVANHVDKTAGYHDPWWDSNGRVRWEGSCNYGNRYSITHGQLGDYGDINSESSEVQARAKAYVEKLKSLGVKGIRWDAAKHIATPSEGCGFWSTVTSVSGMYHYGEILNDDGTPINEYAKYMSVTDNEYSNGAAKDNGGIQRGYGGKWAVNRGVADNKLVYWAESHDTYSNDEWSQNVDQSVIDRAYACIATRNGATALYLARPNAKGFNNIKIGKGTDAYKSNAIAAVNKLRNAAVGTKDYVETDGNVFSCTRQGVGAVIVMKGSGNVNAKNGGNYCPAGTYKDLVSGGTFTVTSSNISGNVGSSGIAVIIKDGATPTPTPDPTPDPTPNPGNYPSMLYLIGNVNDWGTATSIAADNVSNGVYTWNSANLKAAADDTYSYFSFVTAQGADWDADVNSSDRYGASSKDAVISSSATIQKFTAGVDASSAYSWKAAAGTYKVVADLTAMTVTISNGSNPTPDPTPNPDPTPVTGNVVYFDNSSSNWSTVYCYAWSDGASDQNAAWPGVAMTKVDGNIYKYEASASYKNVIFTKGDDSGKTADLTWYNGHIYKADGSHSEYSNPNPDPNPTPDPTPVTGNIVYFDNSGSNWGAVYCYAWSEGASDQNAAWPGVAMTKVDGNIYKYEASTSYKNVIFNNGNNQTDDLSWVNGHVYKADGSHSEYQGGDNPDPNPNPDPIPDPTPGPVIVGDNLITDYYKVNPNGQVGSNRTVNMSFSNQTANGALSHWTAADLIAQGVARDVCQAFKGVHERPIVDSYALYAAYDSQNLYLGVQFVYTVWDLYGEGKQPGESKPYNMDGRLMIAFDLDPNKSFDGYIDGKYGIWNKEGDPGAKFENGVDAIWIGSTKPGVGTPGFFVPTAGGHASYNAPYCKSSTVEYGYADGIASCINNIWGQNQFGYDPEALKSNAGFVDLRSEIDESAHTFYEFKIPLSLLGVSENYIKTQGIGVQYLDVYGSSPVGGTPYDPSFFDNAKDSYSQDPSSSKEKEDEDIIKFAPARIGKAASSVDNISNDFAADANVYGGEGVINIEGAEGQNVMVANLAGQVYFNGVAEGNLTIDATAGVYIVNVAGNGYKVIVK